MKSIEQDCANRNTSRRDLYFLNLYDFKRKMQIIHDIDNQ